MSLRVQKTWQKLGSPSTPGNHNVRGVGTLLNVTQEDIDKAAQLGGNPTVILENQDSGAFMPEWVVIEIRAE